MNVQPVSTSWKMNCHFASAGWLPLMETTASNVGIQLHMELCPVKISANCAWTFGCLLLKFAVGVQDICVSLL